MRYYPVNLDIKGKPCLVVGGGAVAARKVTTLVDCGAYVTVVSPEISDTLQAIETSPRVMLIQRPYRPADLDGKFLVIGATDNEVLNRRISTDAQKQNMLCNIADLPEACSFILPAVVAQGDLVLTVSTSGKSPALAKKLRKDLARGFGEEYARLLVLMGAIRKRLLAAEHAPEAHKPLFEKLIEQGLLEMIKNNATDEVNRLLLEVLGPGYDYDRLMASDD